VSDTTEILSGASGVPEDAPAGDPAARAAEGGSSRADLDSTGATAPASKSRGRGGAGLSSLLMPELQRIAQGLGIPGAGRMRKGQLIEAIEARQGAGARQEGSVPRRGSHQRAASAGADAARLPKQEAMESDTFSRSGIGDGARPGIGDDAAGGVGADGAGQQLSFYAETDQAGRRDGPAQDGGARDGAAGDAQQGVPAHGDTQRGDRRRRNGRRDDQPSRGRDQAARDQSGRDQSGRDQGSRDQGSRDQGSRECSSGRASPLPE
jgi:transcription termination factor Rho